MHNWNIFGVLTSHRQTRTHKTHHGPDLGEAITFPLFMPSNRAYTQNVILSWDSQVGIFEIPKIKTLATLEHY
jgi:hypothetical protein